MQDWTTGKLRYYTQPPEEEASATTVGAGSAIVAEMAAEFSLDELDEELGLVVEELPNTAASEAVLYDSALVVAEPPMETEGPEAGRAAVEDGACLTPAEAQLSFPSFWSCPRRWMSQASIEGNQQRGKELAQSIKKAKKRTKRSGSPSPIDSAWAVGEGG